ncbi:MAG: hypothetical protein AB7K37_05885 [Cyclobacteriaceae bacterium]
MDFPTFRRSLKNDHPPKDLTPLLEALWFVGKDDWDRAHEIAQEDHSDEGSWVHAYLHRVEGDVSNALYWYGRAGKKMPTCTATEEWRQITERLLSDFREPD